MKKNIFQQIIDDPTKIGLVLIGVLLLVYFSSLIFHKKEKIAAPITEGQIQIVKGEEVITINQNGLVEYRSKDKTYYETWDTSQINSFFSMMERKAKDYLSNRVKGGDCGYKVFMFIDKKLVTVCLDSNDEDVSEVVDDIIVRYADGGLTDLFNGDGGEDGENSDEEETDFDDIVYFPTSSPTPAVRRTTPTPTPHSVYNLNTNYAPVKADCETWGGNIVNNHAIISNTYCTVDITPTP